MGRYLINDGADRFNVRDRDTVVASGVSLAAAIELVHQGCRFCDAGQNHTNDAVKSDRHDPGVIIQTGGPQARHRSDVRQSAAPSRETIRDRHR
jgi:hypothetical protein